MKRLGIILLTLACVLFLNWSAYAEPPSPVVLPKGVEIDKSKKPEGFLWLSAKLGIRLSGPFFGDLFIEDGRTMIIFFDRKDKNGIEIPWSKEELKFMNYIRSLAEKKVDFFRYAEADCRQVRRIDHHIDVVRIAEFIQVPAYSAVYIPPSADTEALRQEIKLLREEIQKLKSVPPGTPLKEPGILPKSATMPYAKCASCHDVAVSEKKGGGQAFFSGPRFTATDKQKHAMNLAALTNKMPPVQKLTDQELTEFLLQVTESSLTKESAMNTLAGLLLLCAFDPGIGIDEADLEPVLGGRSVQRTVVRNTGVRARVAVAARVNVNVAHDVYAAAAIQRAVIVRSYVPHVAVHAAAYPYPFYAPAPAYSAPCAPAAYPVGAAPAGVTVNQHQAAGGGAESASEMRQLREAIQALHATLLRAPKN